MKEKLLDSMVTTISNQHEEAFSLAVRSETQILSTRQRLAARKAAERFSCEMHKQICEAAQLGVPRVELNCVSDLISEVEGLYGYALA